MLVDLSQAPGLAPVGSRAGELVAVRSFLGSSQHEREDILAWALRQFDSGDYSIALNQVTLARRCRTLKKSSVLVSTS